MNDEELIKETMMLDYSQLVMNNVYLHKENKRLNNIINKALGIANERVNHYYHINKKEILEDWEDIFNVLIERDNQELKGDDKSDR